MELASQRIISSQIIVQKWRKLCWWWCHLLWGWNGFWQWYLREWRMLHINDVWLNSKFGALTGAGLCLSAWSWWDNEGFCWNCHEIHLFVQNETHKLVALNNPSCDKQSRKKKKRSSLCEEQLSSVLRWPRMKQLLEHKKRKLYI